MDRDVRDAMATVAEESAHPGPRIARWQAQVPRLLSHASQPASGSVNHSFDRAVLLAFAGRPRRHHGALAGVLVALLALGVVAGAGSAMRAPVRRAALHRSAPLRAVRVPVGVVSTASPCPTDERRYDDATAGYHLCLPTQAMALDYTQALRGPDLISVTGFGDESLPPPPRRHDSGTTVAPIMISVSYHTAADVESDEHLVNPTILQVGGQPAREFFLVEPGSPVPTSRVVLVERGDRVYRIEQTAPSGTLTVEYEEMLRTFTFQGLPLWADPELHLDRGVG